MRFPSTLSQRLSLETPSDGCVRHFPLGGSVPKLRSEFRVPIEVSVAIVEEVLLFSSSPLPRGLRLFVAVERVVALEFCEADSITAERDPVCFLEEEGNIWLPSPSVI